MPSSSHSKCGPYPRQLLSKIDNSLFGAFFDYHEAGVVVNSKLGAELQFKLQFGKLVCKESARN